MTFSFGHRDSADTEGEAIQRLHRSLRTLWCGLQWTFGGGLQPGDACFHGVEICWNGVFVREIVWGIHGENRRWVGLISKEGGVCISKSGGCVFIQFSSILCWLYVHCLFQSSLFDYIHVRIYIYYIYTRTDRGSSEWRFPWWARDLEFQGFSGFSRTLGNYLLNVEALKNLHEFWVPKSAKNKKHALKKPAAGCCGSICCQPFSRKNSHPPFTICWWRW